MIVHTRLMAEKRNPLGQTGEAVRANLQRLRDDKNLGYAQLSRRLEQFGRPIPDLGLRRIESGDRRVDVDDLMALAAVLNVSPASLLMPNLASVTSADLVGVTGWQKPITATVVWRWLTAAQPLVKGMLGTFVDHALPSWERERRLSEMGITDGDD